MKNPFRLLLVAAIVTMFVLGYASGHAHARAFAAPDDKQSSGPSRLVVQINNVADENKNRRNHVELFVNGKKIKAGDQSDRAQRDYLYELSLESGVYKIHAVYHAQSFWKEKEFKITTHDGQARLYPDYTTFLTITLEKKSDGTLAREKNLFTETPRLMRKIAAPEITQAPRLPMKIAEPARALPAQVKADEQEPEVSTPAPEARSLVIKPIMPEAPVSAPQPESEPARVTLPSNVTAPAAMPIISLDRNAVSTAAPEASAAPIVEPVPVAVSHVETAAPVAGKIALQINTTPANADVIVDDRFVGQSPLITHVERGLSHVIQISKKGYLEKIKLIDRNELGQQQTYFLVEKLEKEE